MSTYLPLAIDCPSIARILHITDTHLFADNKETLLGVSSNVSFSSVMENIENRKANYDLIVATGDFAQDGSKKAYQRFAQRIRQLETPCVWVAGNHDVCANMDEVFSSYQLSKEKVILVGEHWQIILLNSQVAGHAYGYLSSGQLDFLQQSIAAHPNRYTLVFLHHHPILSGCEWLDNHALKNRDAFESIVTSTQQIRGIGWGHTHQHQEKIWHQRYTFSTPSTCVQFKSDCNAFELSNDDSPGWREVELMPQGSIESTVYRIDGSNFLADLSMLGY